jgi:hypothetical protein
MPSPAQDNALEQSERKMRRETYERAGQEARAQGVPRKNNPFLRATSGPHAGPGENETRRLLAEHWWRGWDGPAPTPEPRRRPLR